MLYEEKKTYKYPYSRRQFMKGIGALGVLSTIPWLGGCEVDTPAVTEGVLGQQSQMVVDVMDILFPKGNDQQAGPSSADINAYQYLKWVLSDENYDEDIKRLIIDGFNQLAEFSQEQFAKPYGKMSSKEKVSLVAQATQSTWGENLMARLVSMILDALVVDPIYGVNVDKVGWKWLGYISGIPRATTTNKYPEILDRKKEMVIISNPKDL